MMDTPYTTEMGTPHTIEVQCNGLPYSKHIEVQCNGLPCSKHIEVQCNGLPYSKHTLRCNVMVCPVVNSPYTTEVQFVGSTEDPDGKGGSL